MKRTVIKIVIAIVIVAILAGAGVALYFHFNSGPITGRVKYGKYYYLEALRPTEQFEGATMNKASYLRINQDGTTGRLYLEGLTATNAPIPLIITNYQEGTKQTTFEIEYLINQGEDTKIQHLTAISTNDCITIRSVESHDVHIIQQKHDQTNTLDYEVDILIFKLNQEAA